MQSCCLQSYTNSELMGSRVWSTGMTEECADLYLKGHFSSQKVPGPVAETSGHFPAAVLDPSAPFQTAFPSLWSSFALPRASLSLLWSPHKHPRLDQALEQTRHTDMTVHMSVMKINWSSRFQIKTHWMKTVLMQILCQKNWIILIFHHYIVVKGRIINQHRIWW